jgi:hypothetical protein
LLFEPGSSGKPEKSPSRLLTLVEGREIQSVSLGQADLHFFSSNGPEGHAPAEPPAAHLNRLGHQLLFPREDTGHQGNIGATGDYHPNLVFSEHAEQAIPNPGELDRPCDLSLVHVVDFVQLTGYANVWLRRWMAR